MNSMTWDDLDFTDEENFSDNEIKSKAKTKKRKWREIESIKEKRRLKKQIAELEQYTL
ncbi:DUF3545 family protein [Colwelliaceae bacterium 6441]